MCLIDTDALGKAADEVDELIDYVYGVNLNKILDPTKKGDYEKIVRRLGAALRKANAGEEAKALRKALQRLDVDWPNMTGKQRNEVIKAASAAFNPLPGKTLPNMNDGLNLSGRKTVKGAKLGSKKEYSLEIATSFTAVDKSITKTMSQQQINFIRDEYGRRQVGFSKSARSIVADGLEQGLGRVDIAEELSQQLTAKGVRRNRWYWELISATFTNRSRTYGQLTSFQDAQIQRYVFEAVMDEATTEICRFMDRKTFEVSTAMQVYQDLDSLADPEDVKFSTPWVTTSRNKDGDQVLSYKQPSGRRRTVAQVQSPGFGGLKPGSYSGGLDPAALSRAGIMMPPLHGFCRSTILADI